MINFPTALAIIAGIIGFVLMLRHAGEVGIDREWARIEALRIERQCPEIKK